MLLFNPQVLQAKMESIVEFLKKAQRPDGEFPTLRLFSGNVENYVTRSEYENWHYFGKCVFTTANIIHHLQEIELAGVKEIKIKGCEFLKRGCENGIFRYVPPYDKPIHFPVDIDDTSLVLNALKQNGYKSIGNHRMIFNNLAPNGDFYTWFIPRTAHVSHPGNFLWLLRDLFRCYIRNKHYGHDFKKQYREYKESAEPSITANVLLYLGEDARTSKLIDRFIKHLSCKDVTLQYYSNPLFLYFHAARLYKSGMKKIDVLKDKIYDFIGAKQDNNGEIENEFNTATAALIFMYFDDWDSNILQKALSYLMSRNHKEKEWTPFPYCNDRHGIFVEGSAELTATFYLEAFYRFYRHQISA